MTNQNDVSRAELRTTEYLPFIESAIDKPIATESNPIDTDIKISSGKVRDIYTTNNSKRILLDTTDRLTGFDRPLGSVPFKGQVLNQTSEFWFNATKHIMPNHLQVTPAPNLMLAEKLKPIPIEFVVRGYLSGSTNTSVWTHYNNGVREYCGVKLPDGMRRNEKFPQPIITPTTKSDEHDELITPDEIVKRGIMTQAEWDYCAQKAIELFNFANQEVAKRGLILVDTKMEMGRHPNGEIVLIDELFTPDSSRYWLKEGYEQAFADGVDPRNIDKEYARKWIKEQCDPYTTKVLPSIPKAIIAEISRRYIMLYELITGKNFLFPNKPILLPNVKQLLQDRDNRPKMFAPMAKTQKLITEPTKMQAEPKQQFARPVVKKPIHCK